MSPDRLLPSFKREVIDKKPEIFKIQALKDIRNIFDQDNSMFAGFGNRESVFIPLSTLVGRYFIPNSRDRRESNLNH